MTNHEIAERFTRIADILELQGENPFKVKAYRNATATIYELEDSLEDIAARNALESLPGFGAAIVAKTKDFLDTGTTALWERIKDDVPQGVVTIAGIPGIGPKTARALWDALGVTTVEELEAAARAEKVRVVAGFGAAKEAAIIEKIERWRRLTARTPRYLALMVAERYARVLATRPDVERVEIGGELRRGCDTVSDITLAVATTNASGVRETLERLTNRPVKEAEDDIGRFIAEDGGGLRIQAYFSVPEIFGFTLIQATGPETYVASLNLPERMQRGKAPDEDTVFDHWGGWLPPEIRDWENAEKHPEWAGIRLVTVEDFRGQLHEHTTYSDGRGTIRDMAEAALARGYEFLAITDHSRSLTIANGLSRDRLIAQLEEIASLKEEYAARGLALLSGIEADILADGSLDCDDDLLEHLDVVVGSVHIRYKEDEAAMTARIVRALENPHLDILGHPTGRLLGRREPYPVDMDAVIATAARHGKVLEINASPDRMDLSDAYARQAKDAGVRLTINADAHSTSGLDMLPWGLCMARRAGLTPDDVINTYPLEKLRAVLAR
jgi:DNA polymerase (family 10)